MSQKFLPPQTLEEAMELIDSLTRDLTNVLRLNKKKSAIVHNLMEENELLKQQAMIDSMTGAFTRYFMERHLEELHALADRASVSSYLVMIDVDDLKPVNDNYGHTVGDDLLACVSKRLASAVRHDDRVCRYAGDEFVVLLCNIEAEGVEAVCQKLRDKVQSTPMKATMIRDNNSLDTLEVSLPVSISVGYTHIDPRKSIKAIMQEADTKMYQEKNGKKNQSDK